MMNDNSETFRKGLLELKKRNLGSQLNAIN